MLCVFPYNAFFMPERKPKPFTMVMVTHAAESVHHLDPWKREITNLLRSSPSGDVVVFMESARGNKEQSAIMQQYLDSGASYSEAFQSIAPPDEPHTASAKKFKGIACEILDGFEDTDRARIRLVMEEQPPDVNQMAQRVLSKAFIERMHGIADWESYLPQLRETLGTIASMQVRRNEQIPHQLMTELDDPDVIGGVGWIGASHTKVTHTLHKEKDENGDRLYSVQRIFPGMVDGTYRYWPQEVVSRTMELLPEENIPDEDLKLYAMGNAAVHGLSTAVHERYMEGDIEVELQAGITTVYAMMAETQAESLRARQQTTAQPDLDISETSSLENTSREVDWGGVEDSQTTPQKTL
jgi:hypothetical protein